MAAGQTTRKISDRGKSQLSLILDGYKFKSYINTIGREELLAGNASDEIVARNKELGRVSDTLFSLSNSPMFTKDFIAANEKGFGSVKDIGRNLQITFEPVTDSILTIKRLNDNIIPDTNPSTSPDIQILNLEHNSFRPTLRSPIVSEDTKATAISCHPQGYIKSEKPTVVSSTKPFSVKDTIKESVNENPNENPTKLKPHLAAYQIFDESLAIGNRQTAELAVFLNMIPTIELSRCVPIISAKFSLPDRFFKGPKTSTKEFTVASNADFLYGSESSETKETMAAYRGDTFVKEMSNKGENVTKKLGIQTNLDVFLAPQTMVNTEEKYSGADSDFPGLSKAAYNRSTPVIDKMRPFMSISSFDIDVKPTRGLLSYKTAQLELVLHDRSRMADIAPFIKPDLFGTFGSEISVEYGWAHPDGTNPFGAIMNLMRAREKYMIVNSTFSLQETGEVKISLSLAMLGATDIVNTNVLGSDSLQRDIKQFEELRKDFSERASKRNVKDVLERNNNYRKIADSVLNASNPFGDAYKKALTKISRQRDNPLQPRAEDLLESLIAVKKEKSKIISLITKSLSQKYDPFLSFDIFYKIGIIDKDGKIIDNTNTNKTKTLDDYISFGKLILAILGKNLTKSGRFNEVQLIYYNTNSKCSKASRINIANIPLNKKFLLEFIKEKIEASVFQFSIGSLIQTISKRFIENKASLIYGFSGIFEYDRKTGNSKVPSNLSIRKAEASQREILYKTYYTEAQYKVLEEALKLPQGESPDKAQSRALTRKVDFVMPKIGFSTEVIYKSDVKRKNELEVTPEPAFSFASSGKDSDTILRVHIFDKSNIPFQGAYDFITDGIKEDFESLNQEMIANRGDLKARGEDRDLQAFTTKLNSALKIINTRESTENLSTDIVIRTKFGTVKETYKKIMPSLTYGSQNSAIKNASFQTINEGRLATVFITRSDRELETFQKTNANAISIGGDDMPLRVLPAKVDLTTIGCPVINFAQSMFFDFGTGTTMDNMYNVTGIKHSIGPGKFESGLTLQYGDIYGKFESRMVSELALESSLKIIIENAKRAEENRKAEEAIARRLEAQQRAAARGEGSVGAYVFNMFYR